MKVLFVLTYYKPHWTGLTQYAARLAEGLAKSGHETTVLCVKHNKNLPKFEIINRVTVYRSMGLFKFIRTMIAPLLLWDLYKNAKNNDAVVIYLPFFEVLPASIIVKFLRKKLYLVHNGDLVLPTKGGIKNRVVEKLYLLTTSKSIELANKIIVQTEDYSQHSRLLSKYKKKWKIILPLYSLSKVSSKEILVFKKRYSLMGKKLIGFSGRFVEEKGVNYLLESIPYVLSSYPNAMFIFAGQKKVDYENYWTTLENTIETYKRNIRFLGLINQENELAIFYHALDVYVQPSRSDCFPSSQVEALLSKVPVVCTNIPGARWVVEKTKMGILVEPRDPRSIAKGIIEILDNKTKYIIPIEKMGKVFDYRKTLAQYEELLQS